MNFEEIKTAEEKAKKKIYNTIERCSIIPAEIHFHDRSSLEYNNQWVIKTSKYRSQAMKAFNWIEKTSSNDKPMYKVMQEIIKNHI